MHSLFKYILDEIDTEKEELTIDEIYEYQEIEIQNKLVNKRFLRCPYCSAIIVPGHSFNEDGETTKEDFSTAVSMLRFIYIPKYNAVGMMAHCWECQDYSQRFYVCVAMTEEQKKQYGNVYYLDEDTDDIDRNEDVYLRQKLPPGNKIQDNETILWINYRADSKIIDNYKKRNKHK